MNPRTLLALLITALALAVALAWAAAVDTATADFQTPTGNEVTR